MEHCAKNPYVRTSSNKCILRSELLSLLRTYNCFHEGKSFQLWHHEEEGELVVEGLLNISWGLRRPIRLQMHDDNERICFSPSEPWRQESLSKIRPEMLPVESPYDPEELNNNANSRNTSEEETPQLKRTRSDASFVQMRTKLRSPGEVQKLKSHRFSINGHFYNHKVENSPNEFALYLLHESGERTKLGETEFPLICRILQGPSERIAKIFMMETDLGEEISHDVAQYIKFEMPVLDSFVKKLKEEEDREIIKLTEKYNALRMMMVQRLEQLHICESYA
ncbi:ras association domain-containing protein 4 isoform X2 [Xenopus tropicalis]|uniref:Ras association domain-containing protein 4 isoform X2 n=1 Tax=Xenopus tropicalis TaxID=8364 RepID=A0A8J1JU89_XENTR|nr:ras association domain-containing protein 4 isoform X2 [Xenopus tropicalis]